MNWSDGNWKKAAEDYHRNRPPLTTPSTIEFNRDESGEWHDAGNGGVSGKTILDIQKSNLPAAAIEVCDLLAQSGLLYNKNGPSRITQPSSDAAPIATPLTKDGVVMLVHDLAQPMRDSEPVTLPDRVANMYLSMRGEWRLPKLTGIANAPILRNDGSISAAVGYDQATGVYCHGFPEILIPDRPTRKQAETALGFIRGTFKTFCFADAKTRFDPVLGVHVVDQNEPPGMDESAFLVGLLTAICRPSLWLAPGLLINAPNLSGAGCGKGLLVRAIGTVAYGMEIRPFTPGNDRHEMDKRLVAEFMVGRPMAAMDNMNGMLLRSNTLASLLTERPSSVRILGKSEMVSIEHAAFIALTGNGLTISEDLARRLLYIELDAHLENPEQRPFAPGFLDNIKERRVTLLAAALTVWRWGRQNADDADAQKGLPLGSFEQWAEWVRDPLVNLGCQDPVARVQLIKQRDPERERVIELFTLWWEIHKDARVRVHELDAAVKEVADPKGQGRQYLARRIQNLAGTRLGGFLLIREEPHNRRKGGALYRLTCPDGEAPKSSASSAPSSPEGKNSDDSGTFGSGTDADARKDPDMTSAGQESPMKPGASAPSSAVKSSSIVNDLANSADDTDDSEPLPGTKCDQCGASTPPLVKVGKVHLHPECHGYRQRRHAR
jgi:hypothetical protein